MTAATKPGQRTALGLRDAVLIRLSVDDSDTVGVCPGRERWSPPIIRPELQRNLSFGGELEQLGEAERLDDLRPYVSGCDDEVYTLCCDSVKVYWSIDNERLARRCR